MNKTNPSAYGRHLLVDYYGCNPGILDDSDAILNALKAAATAANATIVNENVHRFSPYGVSAVLVIQESHLSIHTWPEDRYASADFYTCGDNTDPMAAHDVLRSLLEPREMDVQVINRGKRAVG